MELKHYVFGNLPGITGCLGSLFFIPALIQSSTPEPENPGAAISIALSDSRGEVVASSTSEEVTAPAGEPLAQPKPEPAEIEPAVKDPVAEERRPLDELLNYPGFAERAGQRIWQSECAGTKKGLTSWNDGEGFASLGIGHFLWYPAGKTFEFEESFPDLLAYYQANSSRLPRAVPQWLLETEDCPWNTKSEFDKAASDPRMVQLRDYLHETVPLQTEFIYERLKASRAKLLEHTAPEARERVGRTFDTLLKTPPGFFAMLDYVNFKGEGTSPTEQYEGEGWGLLQVLERMPGDVSPESAHKAFATAATDTLKNRVKNKPSDGKWLRGWTNRTSAYANDF